MGLGKISSFIITLVIFSCSFCSMGADIVISKTQPKVNILEPLETLKTHTRIEPSELLFSQEFTPALFSESNQASQAIYWHRLNIQDRKSVV